MNNENIEGEQPKEETVTAPVYCVFKKGENMPMRGWNWEFVGYAKGGWEAVFKCTGPTKKALKKQKEYRNG